MKISLDLGKKMGICIDNVCFEKDWEQGHKGLKYNDLIVEIRKDFWNWLDSLRKEHPLKLETIQAEFVNGLKGGASRMFQMFYDVIDIFAMLNNIEVKYVNNMTLNAWIRRNKKDYKKTNANDARCVMEYLNE